MIKISKTYQVILLIAVAIFSYACGKESSCFKGTGNIKKEQRTITNEITVIELDDKIDLVLTQSNQASLFVEGGENLLPYINTNLSGNTLSISSDNKCSLFRDYGIPVTVYLSLPNLTKIDYTGQGNISTTNTFNISKFDFETSKGTGSINLSLNATDIAIRQHTGPSDITLAGTAKNVYLFAGENGWFFCQNLIAENVHANNGSSGDITVNATNSLLVELTSIGNIDYYGNPIVTVSIHSGKGKIRKK
jgi:hypothetical protein